MYVPKKYCTLQVQNTKMPRSKKEYIRTEGEMHIFTDIKNGEIFIYYRHNLHLTKYEKTLIKETQDYLDYLMLNQMELPF